MVFPKLRENDFAGRIHEIVMAFVYMGAYNIDVEEG